MSLSPSFGTRSDQQPDNRIALFIDHESLRRSYARIEDSPPEPTELARAAVRFARSLGRVAVARAYDDWSGDHTGPHAFRDAGVEPRLVIAARGPASLLAMGLDAVSHLHSTGRADVVVLIAGDAVLAELTLRIREHSRRVVVIAPDAELDSGIATGAHETLTLDELLQPGEAAPHEGHGRTPRASSSSHAAVAGAPDFDGDGYDWVRFIRLVSWLEDRLPFVGVGYLIKKAMNYENVGTTDVRVKQAIFQHAQERGLVEVYYKENIEEAGDPVAACRLLRDSEDVTAALELLEQEDDGY
ncbi:MAG: NYN domain-containing protein [bacterium]